jgi:hypothetical protein
VKPVRFKPLLDDMTTDPRCGDTCGLIDFTMAIAGDRLLPEERMRLAMEAVQSEKMTQSAAAVKYDVPQQTISWRLEKATKIGSPETSQSEPAISKTPETPAPKYNTRSALRKLCRDNNAPQGLGVNGQGVTSPIARGWLKWAGIDVPPELDGKTILYVPSSKQSNQTQHDTNQPRISPNNCLFVVPDRGDETDTESDNPAFADKLDIDAVRAHVNSQVQQSNRPADFKRAIELLTELDRICTDAWYRRHPEPWGHDDWAHVSSEIEALHSIVGQRAEETADELLRQSSAVEVTSTPVR